MAETTHPGPRALRGAPVRLAAVLVAGALAGLAGLAGVRSALGPRSAPPPAGMPAVRWPERDGYSPRKVELGRLLFFDPRLSSDGKVACATCHDPAKGFADGRRVAKGISGLLGTRNTPSALNAAYHQALFWDSRAASLEEQAKGSLSNRREMTTEPDARSAHEACVRRLRAIPGYVKRFREAYGTGAPTIEHVVGAIAAFERAHLVSGNSAYDRYVAGDRTALTPAQTRGMAVFFEKMQCQTCHPPPLFTNGELVASGIGWRKKQRDLGRAGVTGNQFEAGMFKTPGLRDVALTAPYMHDGSLETLDDVVEHYDKGEAPAPDVIIDDRLLGKRNLTEQDKQDLVAFLESLTGTGWQPVRAPSEFPP